MIELKKGSDAELGYRTSTMTYEQAAVVLADRPDLLAMHRRLCGRDRNERIKALLDQWHSKPKQKARTKDVRDMTVRELCALAEEVRNAPVGSRKLRRAADRMSIAAWHLRGGALQQMLWWDRVEPEAPPDGKGEVVQMPPR